jgi:hypothetical protein
MESYSPFFQTLHDERFSTGHLGNGTHVSILRAIVFSDRNLRPLRKGADADFAIIWDADHDTRIIKAVEAIYRGGFLSSILMIGERKGTLHAVVPEALRTHFSGETMKYIGKELEAIAQAMENDAWSSSLCPFGSPNNKIIDDDNDKVSLYLANLKMLWRLGVRVGIDDHLSFESQRSTTAV